MTKKFFSIVVLSLLVGACSTNLNSQHSVESSIISSESAIEPSSISAFSSLISSSSEESSVSIPSSVISENSQGSIVISSNSSSNSSSSSSLEEPESFEWKIDTQLRGVEFRNALKLLIDKERLYTTTYKNCLAVGAKAAAYPSKTSVKFVPFYHGTDTLTSTSSCNREHTWPNSRGSGETGPGADPFIIRPTLTADNSSRGNFFYGTGGKLNSEWDPASLGYEPSRGEAARIILYAATAYYDYGFSLSNNPTDATSLKTMGTLKYLIRWNKQYAPTEMEIRINDYLYSVGYGRNPFVDNPEFAEYIWSENGLVGSVAGSTQSSSEYELVDALEDIDGLNLAIVSREDEGSFYGLTSSSKSETLPWYLVGVPCDISNENKKMTTTYESLAFYYFQQEMDGYYTIKNGKNYLFNYIDGTHYSIGLGTTPTNNGSIYWDIESNGNGSYTLLGKRGVYLEYYRSSFCGYSNKPTEGIYLYK